MNTKIKQVKVYQIEYKSNNTINTARDRCWDWEMEWERDGNGTGTRRPLNGKDGDDELSCERRVSDWVIIK